ncbi:hypothetical protein SAMN02799625_04540 [Methylobacterium sp. UNC300MFChir4.1]|uniref:hypothetical protein n=1 Tax=Methylobacterium sp. UNC300MFChir4.1 TaxID=1502747 RepID=UPI0008B0CF27|nr:hypothetical protein [Methylobacterium sp. UNC300MFChir4.1]SEP04779.1 hypothetical protein SAMN02799625_04540 [Methylobacterium sp. UNC300MFChir4.1]
MRALLTLTCGGPGRVATSAGAIVAILAVASGNASEVLRAGWITGIVASGFVFTFAVLAMIGAATGVCDETPAPPKEADHG